MGFKELPQDIPSKPPWEDMLGRWEKSIGQILFQLLLKEDMVQRMRIEGRGGKSS